MPVFKKVSMRKVGSPFYSLARVTFIVENKLEFLFI